MSSDYTADQLDTIGMRRIREVYSLPILGVLSEM